MMRLLAATLLACALAPAPLEAAPRSNRIVSCVPAPCMRSGEWGPTRSQWIEGVVRIHTRITASQAAAIWDMPNKFWRDHIPWQRRTVNYVTPNPATSSGGGGICAVTTRTSARNGWGERMFSVHHHKEWHGDDSWDVELIGYHTWSSFTDVGGLYHLASWPTVEDWWSTRGGSGSLHSFHGTRRTGLFPSITIPILGFSMAANLSTYMGAYYDRTVETGNNDRESCYTID